jgi:hypothetical protein
MGGFLAFAVAVAAGEAFAQQLRFTTGYRELEPPDYANLRVGPFYSSLNFVQTVGARYSASTTNIVNIVSGARKGVFRKDGFEIPMVSSLAMRNYLPISKKADLDASVSCSYSHYPMKTQADQFSANLADQQITADFNVNYQSRLAPNLNLKAYARPVYSTDYVDLTGRIDEYGGSAYERLQNIVGIQADYLVRRHMNLAADVSRSDVWPQVNAFSNQMNTTYNGALACEWQVHPKFATGMKAAFSSGSYPRSEDSGFFSQSYLAFAGADVTKNSKASASLGYSISGLSSSSGTGDTDSGAFVGSLSLATEFTKDIAQSVSFSRSQHRGFESGIETTDSLQYNIARKGEFLTVTLAAGADGVNVAAGDISRYANKHGGISIAYAIAPNTTITLSADSSFRDNGKASTDATAPELTSDYNTRVSRISTAWQPLRAMTVTAYAQYASRGSKADNMKYEQYMVGVDCGYSYEF